MAENWNASLLTSGSQPSVPASAERVAVPASSGDGEERFRRLFHSAPVAVFVCDRAGVIQDYNGMAAHLWGREPVRGDLKEVNCGSLRLRLPSGEVLPHSESPIVEVLRGGVAQDGVEVMIERPDGSLVTVLVNFAPLMDPAGQVAGAITSFIDVTERKRAESLVAEQCALLERIAMGASLEECLEALCRSVSRLNPGARAAVLLADGEGATFTHAIAPDLLPSFAAGIPGLPIDELMNDTAGEALFGGEAVSGNATPGAGERSNAWRELYRESGVFACHSTPVPGANGEHLASFFLCLDDARSPNEWEQRLVAFGVPIAAVAIERARREQSLAADHADLQVLADFSARLIPEGDLQVVFDDAVRAAIAIADADGGSLQLLDSERNDLVLTATRGLPASFLEHFARIGASSNTSCAAALARGSRAFVTFADVVRKGDEDGHGRLHLDAGIVLAQSTPLLSRSGRRVGMISTHWRRHYAPGQRKLQLLDLLARQTADLIERHQAEEELRRAGRLKDELLGMVSHEFRTPLTTITGNIEVLTRRFDELRPEVRREVLSELQRDAGRLKRLIQNMLIIARGERSQESEPEPMLLQRVLPEFVAACMRSDPSRPILATIQDDLPPVLATYGYLDQILENLVTNSRKYGAPGTPIEITAELRDRRVAITVSDQGKEFTEEEATRFLEAFYRSESVREQSGGAGLGLAVCARLVGIFEGTLRASPRPGGGLQVTVTLPIAPGAE